MTPSPARRRRTYFASRSARRGVALVLVIGLLAISMALSYAVMRSQFTVAMVQSSSQNVADARSAAVSGLHLAIRAMHRSDWTGVGTSISGNISDSQSYTATFAVGDPSLTPASYDWTDYPWRVTIEVVGTATHPSTGAPAQHPLRGVVRFVPRQTGATPAQWSQANSYTLLQTSNVSNVRLHAPMRIEGNVRVQGELKLGDEYTWSDLAQVLYYTSLKLKQVASGTDWRLFDAIVDLPLSASPQVTRDSLTGMGVTARDTAAATIPSWAFTGTTYQYRLYPGGQTYDAPWHAAGVLQDVTLGPDVLTNPLGIHKAYLPFGIGNNVTVSGTLLVTNSIFCSLWGTNIQMHDLPLPAIQGATDNVALPVAMFRSTAFVDNSSSVTLRGFVGAENKLEIQAGSQNFTFNLNGKLATGELCVHGRSEWIAADWSTLYTDFLAYGGPLVFTDWLAANASLSSQPKIRIHPQAGMKYHWSPTGGDIFVKHPDDEGLRWELLSVTDAPGT